MENQVICKGVFSGGDIEPGIFHGGELEPGTFHSIPYPLPDELGADSEPLSNQVICEGWFHGGGLEPGTFHHPFFPEVLESLKVADTVNPAVKVDKVGSDSKATDDSDADCVNGN